jgi:hypothetical protein
MVGNKAEIVGWEASQMLLPETLSFREVVAEMLQAVVAAAAVAVAVQARLLLLVLLDQVLLAVLAVPPMALPKAVEMEEMMLIRKEQDRLE